MDNSYSVPEMFIMLKTQNEILACWTTFINWKGWDQSSIHWTKSAPRSLHFHHHSATAHFVTNQ